MRGKLIVISMLAAAALLFVYSLWFVNNHSPVDERFNMRRESLADDTPGPLILRERAGDYNRKSLEVDSLDTPGTSRHGIATYLDFEGKVIQLEVQLMSAPLPSIETIFESFPARAGAVESRYITLKLHPEARIPYGFGTYAASTYTYYELGWLNGNWIIRVSTREAGQESLLRFANSYVY